ncbi:uncharacterized protein LOC100177214 [Ciona intestinalis]
MNPQGHSIHGMPGTIPNSSGNRQQMSSNPSLTHHQLTNVMPHSQPHNTFPHQMGGNSLHLPNPSGYSQQMQPHHQIGYKQTYATKNITDNNEQTSEQQRQDSLQTTSRSQIQGPPSISTPYSSVHPMTPRTPAEFGVGPPQLQNIVSTVNLDTKLDLKRIALHARNAEYNPKRFAAVIMRIREPRTTALIFSSGKMVCTGAKSENASRLAARKYARVVQKLGFPAKFIDFKIQNMVGSVDVKFPIRLEGLVLAHSQFSSYEPELFPGLIYRMVKPRIVLLIFVSGKVVLTGAKVYNEIEEAFNNIYPILKGYRKTS